MRLHPGTATFLLALAIGAFAMGIARRAEAQAPAPSPTPARRHNFGLEARSVANGGSSVITGSNSGAPATAVTAFTQSVGDRRVSSNRTNVEFSVHNFAAATDSVRVEWYFVAKPASVTSGEREFIVRQDAQVIPLAGGRTGTRTVSSPEVQAVYERATTIASAPVGYTVYGGYTSTVSSTSTQKGLTIGGWMVRLVAEDGAVLAVKGSSQKYEDIAANSAKLDGMLARPMPAGR